MPQQGRQRRNRRPRGHFPETEGEKKPLEKALNPSAAPWVSPSLARLRANSDVQEEPPEPTIAVAAARAASASRDAPANPARKVMSGILISSHVACAPPCDTKASRDHPWDARGGSGFGEWSEKPTLVRETQQQVNSPSRSIPINPPPKKWGGWGATAQNSAETSLMDIQREQQTSSKSLH